MRASTRAWLGGRPQGGIGGGGALRAAVRQLARPRQLAAAHSRQQRAQPQGQGEAADRGLALTVGEALAAGFEAPDRAGRFFAADGGAAEFLGDQPGAGGGALGALRQQPTALRAFGDPAAQPRHRPRRPPQPGPKPLQLPKPRPMGRFPTSSAGNRPIDPGGQGLAEAAERDRGVATGPGPITARTPGSAAIRRCQRASRARSRLVVIGPRSVAATRTKGASQPGPTARVDRFGALARLVGGRQLVDAGGTGGEGERRQRQQDQRHRHQAGREGGVAKRRGGGAGDGRTRPAGAAPADPAGVDPLPEQRQQRRHREGRDDDADRP